MPRANRISCLTMYGTLHTVVTRKNFYSSLHAIDGVGDTGFLKQKALQPLCSELHSDILETAIDQQVLQ